MKWALSSNWERQIFWIFQIFSDFFRFHRILSDFIGFYEIYRIFSNVWSYVTTFITNNFSQYKVMVHSVNCANGSLGKEKCYIFSDFFLFILIFSDFSWFFLRYFFHMWQLLLVKHFWLLQSFGLMILEEEERKSGY